jgi:hypothetical protein
MSVGYERKREAPITELPDFKEKATIIPFIFQFADPYRILCSDSYSIW